MYSRIPVLSSATARASEPSSSATARATVVSCLAPPPQGAGRRRPPDALLGKDLHVQYHLFMISRFLVLCRLPPDALFGKGLQVQYQFSD
jgi:hypothetical protein